MLHASIIQQFILYRFVLVNVVHPTEELFSQSVKRLIWSSTAILRRQNKLNNTSSFLLKRVNPASFNMRIFVTVTEHKTLQDILASLHVSDTTPTLC